MQWKVLIASKQRREDRERGSVLLEFGLVTIVLFMLIFGVIDFGRALYAYHFVSHAAREATRFAIVRGANCRLPDACPAQASDVQNYVVNTLANGIGLNSNAISVNAVWPGSSYDGVTNCTTSAPNSPGCPVQVQVQYGFNFVFPLMPTSVCNIQTGSATIKANICMSSTAEMVISQ
jgi:Flp pilus assembly protein TadG